MAQTNLKEQSKKRKNQHMKKHMPNEAVSSKSRHISKFQSIKDNLFHRTKKGYLLPWKPVIFSQQKKLLVNARKALEQGEGQGMIKINYLSVAYQATKGFGLVQGAHQQQTAKPCFTGRKSSFPSNE